MSEFAEKARTIGVSLKRGKSNRKPVMNQDDGSVAGHEIEHWDDRQDAVAMPKSVEVKTRRD